MLEVIKILKTFCSKDALESMFNEYLYHDLRQKEFDIGDRFPIVSIMVFNAI